MKCAWHKGCDKEAETRHWCQGHYEKLLNARLIEGGMVDATPVRNHIIEFISRGGNYALIERRCGVARKAVKRIADGVSRTVRISTSRRILSIALPPTAIGVVRRVRALGRIGYTQQMIARQAGYASLDSGMAQMRFSVPVREAIARVYEDFSGRIGPSQLTIDRSKKPRPGFPLGYPAPLAWHCVDIDDPNASPELPEIDSEPFDEVHVLEMMAGRLTPYGLKCGPAKRHSTEMQLRAAQREAIARLLAAHYSSRWIAERISCSLRTVDRIRAEIKAAKQQDEQQDSANAA